MLRSIKGNVGNAVGSARTSCWVGLTTNPFQFKVNVLTDGLGLIGLIYKLPGHNFIFGSKWRIMTVITSYKKIHFLQRRERSLPQRRLNLNIFERRLSLNEKVHKLSDVFS